MQKFINSITCKTVSLETPTQQSIYDIFRTRATLGDRSFYVASLKLWKRLPREIRALTDIRTLKSHLKLSL